MAVSGSGNPTSPRVEAQGRLGRPLHCPGLHFAAIECGETNGNLFNIF
jgi:hypothetical protein